jgi:hypothetical protein
MKRLKFYNVAEHKSFTTDDYEIRRDSSGRPVAVANNCYKYISESDAREMKDE